MLGVSESRLRQWGAEGKVHRAYHVRKNVVLFDAMALANDWNRMEEKAEIDFKVSSSPRLGYFKGCVW